MGVNFESISEIKTAFWCLFMPKIAVFYGFFVYIFFLGVVN